MRPLFQRIVLGVFEDHLQIVMLLGSRSDVGVHLHAPRLAQIALAHTDSIALFGRRLVRQTRLRTRFPRDFRATAGRKQGQADDDHPLRRHTLQLPLTVKMSG